MATITIQVLKTDGTKETKQISKEGTLQALQAEVGGYIEVVHHVQGIPKGKILVCNEEGEFKQLSANPFCPGLVGNIVIMNSQDLD